MPVGLLNCENVCYDPENSELLAGFIAPRVGDPAGPDRVTLCRAAITLSAR